MTVFKSLPMEIKAVGNGNLVFKISTKMPDRDEDILEPMGCDLSNYRSNPVVLFAHDYQSPPIGKSLRESIYPEFIESEVEFAPTAFAQDCKKLCEGGFLNAASVGFNGIEAEPIPQSKWGKHYTKWELLEWSIVPVPANASCLIQGAKAKGLNLDAFEKELTEMQKAVIPYKKYPLADEGAAWDGPAEISAASIEDLKVMCAWYDAENADVKQAYKLPHHTKDGYTTVWRAVAAAMAALLGARGGVQIPEADRKGVYNHLAKHYDDFGKTAPDFKEYSDIEIKDMFPEETKSGATISAKNRAFLEEIHNTMKACHNTMKACNDRLKQFMDDNMPPDGEPCEPPEDPMMDMIRTTVSEQMKSALEEIRVLFSCQKDASKDINLAAIEFVKSSKPLDEPEIPPDELVKMIKSEIQNQLKGGNS